MSNAPSSLDVLHMFLNARFMVQFVLLLLLFFSITSWTIIFIKYVYLRKALSESLIFAEFFWKKRNFSEAYAESKKMTISPVAKVFRAGYVEMRRLKSGDGKKNAEAESGPANFDLPIISSIERALHRGVSAEMAKLNQLVPFLADRKSVV